MNYHLLGWCLSGLATLPVVLSGTMQLVRLPAVLKNFNTLGLNPGVLVPFGLAQYVIAALYLVPQTALLGAILATGWMGGAIATHLRVGEKPVVQIIIPILVWVGWGLRNPEIMHLAFEM